MVSRTHSIYARLVELSEPFTLPELVASLTFGEEFRRTLPPDPKIVEGLLEQFGAEDVRKAGVLVDGRSGQGELCPGLTAEGVGMIALRDRRGEVVDILTVQGCLSGNVPLYPVLEDARARGLLKANVPVMGVVDLSDLFVFRGLGIPATPVVGLDRPTPMQIKLLVAMFGHDSGGMVFDGETPKLPAEFAARKPNAFRDGPTHSDVAWKLVLCPHIVFAKSDAVSPTFEALAGHLAKLARSLEVDWPGLRVWWPSAEERERMLSLLALGSTRTLRRRILECEPLLEIDGSSDPTKPPKPPHPLAEVPAALEAFHRAMAKWNASAITQTEYRKARAAWLETVDKKLIHPMIEQALDEPTALRQNHGVALAEVYRIVHLQLPSIEEQADKLSAAPNRDIQLTLGEQIRDMGRMMGTARWLSKTLSQSDGRLGRHEPFTPPPDGRDPAMTAPPDLTNPFPG